VIVSWWTTFWAPAYGYLCRQLQKEGIPVIYLIHNVLPHETRPWDRWMAKLALNQGNAFIVQSVQEQTTLQDLIPHARIILSPHPIYTQFNAGSISRNEAREKLHLTIEDRVALFFGIIRPYKGLQNAIQAIAQMRESGKRVILLIAGEIWGSKHEYMDQVQRLGIADQVVFDDRYIPNEEVSIFFSAADVFLAPYRSSTQSGVSKIAMAFGLPLVVTSTVAQGIGGDYPGLFVVPSEDSLELANAIEKALNQKMSEVITDFSTIDSGWDQLAQAITELVATLKS
jgi:glycosyltransferase involved in cell wall biosynthesis